MKEAEHITEEITGVDLKTCARGVAAEVSKVRDVCVRLAKKEIGEDLRELQKDEDS